MPKYELRQRGQYWVIYWWDKRTNQPRRRATGETDYSAAQTKLAQWIIEQPQQLIEEPTVLYVMLRYWEHRGKDSFARDSVKRVLALVAEHEPDTLIYHWPIPKQQEFAAKLGNTDGTRRRYMGVIRAALQWAADRGEIPSVPTIIKVKANDAPGARPFTIPELQRLFEKAAPQEHWRRLLLLCLCTGQRPGAVLALTWDRIDPKTGICDLDEPGRKQTKKRRSRMPLPTPAHAYLEARRSIGPVIQYRGRQLAGFKETMRRLTKDANVKGTAYGLRKSAATWARSHGVPESDIKTMLGHTLGGQTQRYAHERPEYMDELKAAQTALLQAVGAPWLAEYFAPRSEPLTEAELSAMAQQRAANEG